MEGVRNAAPGLKGRAIAGPHDYEQIPALVDRSKLRVANFLSDLDTRLADAPFVAGDQFSLAGHHCAGDDRLRRKGIRYIASGGAPGADTFAVSARSSTSA
jgi:glutathione S-transferase